MAKETHDRKTRLNIGVPRSLLPWFETTRQEHPGIWKSNGELVLDALRLGMRAYHDGARPPPPPARREAGAGYLTVSAPFQLVSWFDAALASRADSARSRRDLILDVLRLGMHVFEGSGASGGIPGAPLPADEDLLVPADLIRQIRKLLTDHPLLVTDGGYAEPADVDFVERAIPDILRADGDSSADTAWIQAAVKALPHPLAKAGPKGAIIVTRAAVQALRRIIEGDPALARSMEYATPGDFVGQAIRRTLVADADLVADLEWNAAHPQEAAAREAWWRTVDEARRQGDTARLAELGQEQARAAAEGRPPWQKAARGDSRGPRTAKAPGAKYAPGT